MYNLAPRGAGAASKVTTTVIPVVAALGATLPSQHSPATVTSRGSSSSPGAAIDMTGGSQSDDNEMANALNKAEKLQAVAATAAAEHSAQAGNSMTKHHPGPVNHSTLSSLQLLPTTFLAMQETKLQQSAGFHPLLDPPRENSRKREQTWFSSKRPVADNRHPSAFRSLCGLISAPLTSLLLRATWRSIQEDRRRTEDVGARLH